ncbi:hypothetical protein [Gallaecimonas pentaromativorans]|uniref:Uncharacterized protein n=1 Tax=Gallaecimonas pentaromativorans TaxID=584787 RepID=A0A3N1P7C0_9GAMM|nr:hypothetical protein [Gallaecimonas pentaromativorans]ROQ23371.1 hypothetical protein EDC28_108109 [Gallaecimonas pentaromativorans]
MMMKKYWQVLLVSLMVFPSFATTMSNVKITTLMMDKSHGNLLFIKTDKTHTSGSPDCYASSWSFVFQLDGTLADKMYSALLAAKTTNTTITLVGSDSCELYGGIETLRRLEL